MVRDCGRGGQGSVCEVVDISGERSRQYIAEALHEALKGASNTFTHMYPDGKVYADLIGAIRMAVHDPVLPRGALKKLLPLDEAVNADTARERMAREIDALQRVKHPALVNLLDSRIGERWFVMEFMSDGTLETRLPVFKARVLESLTVFRPIVEAVSCLHQEGIVHRDIKPANIFGSPIGLKLGDLGLAIELDSAGRLTETFENVGTADYQPPWSRGMRLDEVTPTFDVFGLAKVMWAMVAGRRAFPYWEVDRPDNSLSTLFPDNGEVLYVQRILRRCIAREERDVQLRNAGELLTSMDTAIQAIRHGAQVPSLTRKLVCRFCGLGTYREGTAIGQHMGYHALHCSVCGHLETFRTNDPHQPRLPIWSEND